MSARNQTTLSDSQALKALLRRESIYILGGLIDDPAPTDPGRRREQPNWMLFLYLALISQQGSARRVERFLNQGWVWKRVRKFAKRRFPDQPELRVPAKRMTRDQYRTLRDGLCDEANESFAEVRRILREDAVRLAHQIGLCRPDQIESWTHPDPENTIEGDGKVQKPISKRRAGETFVDPRTGEVRPRRFDPDAAAHKTGTGEWVKGSKYALLSSRSNHPNEHVIFDVDYVPKKADEGEAGVSMGMIRQVLPLLRGVETVVYDTAFRGKHLRELLQLGVIGIAPMAAKVKGDTPEERLPKDGLLGKATLTTPSGTAYEVDIYVNDGVPFLADFNVLGEMTATPLERIKIERRPNKQGFRWYGVYRVPSTGDTLRIRLDRLPTDVSNREENLRPFPPGDPDYKRLYGRRPDTESINSLLVRCSGQWGRAHSYGWRRQFLDLVGFALLINAGAAASFERRVAAGRPPDAATP